MSEWFAYHCLTISFFCFLMSMQQCNEHFLSFSVVSCCRVMFRPAHIYDNVGRYDDCITVSQLSVTSDNAYLSSCFVPAYDIHNKDVLVSCAVMGGRLAAAMPYAVPAGALLSEAMAATAMGSHAMRPFHYTLAAVSQSPSCGLHVPAVSHCS